MTWPTFLIVGAGRTGTTSLYHYLRQHPDVFMSPVKEPGFFAYEGQTRPMIGAFGQAPLNTYSTTASAYEALYSGVSTERVVGEASVDYLYLPRAAERIRHYVPNVKLIAILRQPAERAYSQFWARVASGREPLTDFELALNAESERIQTGWAPEYHYRQKGFYAAAIQRYRRLFSESQMKVLFHEDFDAAPMRTMREIVQFLGVDESFVPDTSERYNLPRGVPKHQRLSVAMRRPHPVGVHLKRLLPASVRFALRRAGEPRNWGGRPPLTPRLRRRLTDDYRGDILVLQKLFDRDLSAWLR